LLERRDPRSQRRGEFVESVPFEHPKVRIHGARRIPEPHTKFTNHGANEIWTEIELVSQEVVWVLGLNAEGCECRVRKVFQVVGDDQVRIVVDDGIAYVRVHQVTQSID
jgi:hypothetical protein